MFVSQAHSFSRQARLAVTLAWIAGYTNVLTILTCGTVTSHATGITSNLGRDLFSGAWGMAGFGFFLLTCFYFGSATSGFCTELARRRGWDSIYVFPMAIEALLLACFAIFLEFSGQPVSRGGAHLYLMTGLASSAMGLQNATITRISGGTLRTTHVTGILTDLGQETVQFVCWLRDRLLNAHPDSRRGLFVASLTHPSARRLALLGAIISTFALGAGLGSLAYAHAHQWAMFPPVVFLIWVVYLDVVRPIAEIQPSALVVSGSGLDLPETIAVYQLSKGRGCGGKTHRMPDLLAWSDRLPAAARVVILDLAAAMQIDSNGAFELRLLLSQLESQGRRLIIAGISGAQFQQINISGSGRLLRADSVCPDLELAIARGLNLLQTG